MRLSNWDSRLSALVREKRKAPHAFGSWDCLLWPAAAVKAVTGKDFGRGHRGKYKSLASAYRHLQDMGFASPEALLDSLFEQKSVGFAQKGDLVLASDGIPAVCVGAFALSVGREGGREGFVKVQRSDWVKSWRVG